MFTSFNSYLDKMKPGATSGLLLLFLPVFIVSVDTSTRWGGWSQWSSACGVGHRVRAAVQQETRNIAACSGTGRSCSRFPPPDNGGAVCVLDTGVNAKYCTQKCSFGYDFLVRPMSFHVCGPSSDWKWTKYSNMVPCVEEFFPGVQFEAPNFYFTKSCTSLSSSEKTRLATQFITFLKGNGNCKPISNCTGCVSREACRLQDARVLCGRTD